MVTNKYFPKLQPKLQTCYRSVQEIRLGHLAGLDAVDDVDVGLHRLVGVLGKDTVVLHPVTTSCRNPLNEIRSLRRLIAYFCNSLSFGLPIKQARSYAEILDALLGDWEKSYEVVNELLERKRRELVKRNNG